MAKLQTDGNITRSAQDKCEDLKDFLHTLVGYLPFPYLTEKIVHASTSLDNVWATIYEHYGLNVTGETLLVSLFLTGGCNLPSFILVSGSYE